LHAQGLWTQKASLPATGRYDGIGFSIDNFGYAGLGYNDSKTFTDFWQYNPSSNSWKKMADFPGKGRIWPATFVIGHKAYVICGADSAVFNYVSECWVYDATTNVWAQKNNFPGLARVAAFGFSIGNKGYMGTGCNSSSYFKDFWEYDTTSDTWTQKADFGGYPRCEANGFAINDTGYVCFGQDTVYQGYTDIWEYDTASNSWTQKSDYPGVPIFGSEGFVIGTNIYLGTGATKGASNDSYEQDFWKYNVLTDKWTPQAKFIGNARTNGNTAFSIADSGYIGMGTDSIPDYYHDFYKFYPDTLTGINELSVNEKAISIYPNPTNGDFTLKVANNRQLIGDSKIEVYNVLGEIVYEETLSPNEGKYKINLSNATTGVYTLKVYYSADRVENCKLIIIK